LIPNTGRVQLVENLAGPIVLNGDFIKWQTLGQLKGDEQNLLCKVFKFTLKN
jgi:hypothetical protein